MPAFDRFSNAGVESEILLYTIGAWEIMFSSRKNVIYQKHIFSCPNIKVFLFSSKYQKKREWKRDNNKGGEKCVKQEKIHKNWVKMFWRDEVLDGDEHTSMHYYSHSSAYYSHIPRRATS